MLDDMTVIASSITTFSMEETIVFIVVFLSVGQHRNTN